MEIPKREDTSAHFGDVYGRLKLHESALMELLQEMKALKSIWTPEQSAAFEKGLEAERRAPGNAVALEQSPARYDAIIRKVRDE